MAKTSLTITIDEELHDRVRATMPATDQNKSRWYEYIISRGLEVVEAERDDTGDLGVLLNELGNVVRKLIVYYKNTRSKSKKEPVEHI